MFNGYDRVVRTVLSTKQISEKFKEKETISSQEWTEIRQKNFEKNWKNKLIR